MPEQNEIDEIFTAVYKIMGNPKTAEVIAKMYKNIFEALKKEGFTEEQSLSLVRALNLGSGK